MQETWLRTNRRILLLGMILPAVLILGGLIVVAVAQSGVRAWFYYVGLAAAAFGLALFVILLPQIFRPRLAYAEGEILVYLRAAGRFVYRWKLWNVFSWARRGAVAGRCGAGNSAAKPCIASGRKSDRFSTSRRQSGAGALGRRLCRFSRSLVRTAESGSSKAAKRALGRRSTIATATSKRAEKAD